MCVVEEFEISFFFLFSFVMDDWNEMMAI